VLKEIGKIIKDQIVEVIVEVVEEGEMAIKVVVEAVERIVEEEVEVVERIVEVEEVVVDLDLMI
jgi:hypothetical protein